MDQKLKELLSKSGQPVAITVSLKTKPGFEARLHEVLTQLIGLSRAEDGCLNYYMHQSVDDPRTFLLYMNWQDQEAFQHHVQTSWVQEFDRNQAAQLLAEPYLLTRWRHLG
jgi:quinol monooxygenase YgiN